MTPSTTTATTTLKNVASCTFRNTHVRQSDTQYNSPVTQTITQLTIIEKRME